ncbi:phosphotransferase family protein [soil metagenome]
MASLELSDRIAGLPCWSTAVEISPLPGGMTNRNFLVLDRRQQRFVVRVGQDLPEHGVMRFNELSAARAAHAAGISPEVIHAAEGMLVSRYIAGRTLTPEDVREAGNLAGVVDLVRRCQLDLPRYLRGPSLVFWPFQVIRNYLGLLGEAGSHPPGLDLAALSDRAAWLERVLGPVNIVFGHNDLLAANLIDDGARLWLIDWDYAGFNSPLFDLANLSSNNAFTPELDRQLLDSYFAGAISDTCQRGLLAMKCASLLRELLWAAVSQLHSSIDFDYATYAVDYMARFEQMWWQVHDELQR